MSDLMKRLAKCDAVPRAWRGWDVDACDDPAVLRAFAADLVRAIEHYYLATFKAEQERETAVGLADHEEVELKAERARRCGTCAHQADCDVLVVLHEYLHHDEPDGLSCAEHAPR